MTENHPNHLMLPAAASQAADDITRLDVEGPPAKLDELGPVVVNSDGTLSRIANWANMTDAERDRTMRVLSARNKIRLANQEKKGDTEIQSPNSH